MNARTLSLAIVGLALFVGCAGESTSKPPPNTTVKTTYPESLPPGVGGCLLYTSRCV